MILYCTGFYGDFDFEGFAVDNLSLDKDNLIKSVQIEGCALRRINDHQAKLVKVTVVPEIYSLTFDDDKSCSCNNKTLVSRRYYNVCEETDEIISYTIGTSIIGKEVIHIDNAKELCKKYHNVFYKFV